MKKTSIFNYTFSKLGGLDITLESYTIDENGEVHVTPNIRSYLELLNYCRQMLNDVKQIYEEGKKLFPHSEFIIYPDANSNIFHIAKKTDYPNLFIQVCNGEIIDTLLSGTTYANSKTRLPQVVDTIPYNYRICNKCANKQ